MGKRALGWIQFLYFSFDVLVITDIPPEVQGEGLCVSYMERGWCWAEASIARIGNRLHRLSPSVCAILDEDESVRRAFNMSLSEALCGHEKYPPELLHPSKAEELLCF